MDLRGYLHSKGNNCTGKSLGLFAYRTSKGVMLIKSTDALIHFGYTRYFHYYRIREVLEALILFVLLSVDVARSVNSGFLNFKMALGAKPRFKLRKNTS